MNSLPLVTTVITTYKREVKIVERALLSVLNQTYKRIEIIIINDCPEDKKLATQLKNMIKKYQKNYNIKYIIVEKNGGACKARNIGLNMCKGKYIAFLDDDDEWISDKIELQLKALIKEPDCAISYCNAYFYNADKNKTTLRFKNKQPSGSIFNELLEKNIIGSCSFPMFKTNIIKKYKGFSEEMPAMQDWELYLRICEDNKVIYIDKPLVRYYRYDGERISRNSKKRTKAFELMRKKYIEKFSNNKKALYNFYLMAANDYSIDKKIIIAIKYLFKAVKIKPLYLKTNFFFLAKVVARIFVNKNNM